MVDVSENFLSRNRAGVPRCEPGTIGFTSEDVSPNGKMAFGVKAWSQGSDQIPALISVGKKLFSMFVRTDVLVEVVWSRPARLGDCPVLGRNTGAI